MLMIDATEYRSVASDARALVGTHGGDEALHDPFRARPLGRRARKQIAYLASDWINDVGKNLTSDTRLIEASWESSLDAVRGRAGDSLVDLAYFMGRVFDIIGVRGPTSCYGRPQGGPRPVHLSSRLATLWRIELLVPTVDRSVRAIHADLRHLYQGEQVLLWIDAASPFDLLPSSATILDRARSMAAAGLESIIIDKHSAVADQLCRLMRLCDLKEPQPA